MPQISWQGKDVNALEINFKGVHEEWNEYQLEDHFIKPIFEKLGHYFEVQEKDRKGKRPDYAFFQDDEIRRKAIDDSWATWAVVSIRRFEFWDLDAANIRDRALYSDKYCDSFRGFRSYWFINVVNSYNFICTSKNI